MRKYVAEFLGTFTLVFAGCGAIVIDDVSEGKITHVGVALTFGLVVTAMVYAVGDVSGAHLNPAVSAGLWLARRFPLASVAPYAASQLLGALAAAGLLRLLFDHPTLGTTIPAGQTPWPALVLETACTAFLVFVILGFAEARPEKAALGGLVVGGVIAFEALFAGPISGASMNPARSLGPAIVSGRLADVWVYLAGPFLGAAIGVAARKGIEN